MHFWNSLAFLMIQWMLLGPFSVNIQSNFLLMGGDGFPSCYLPGAKLGFPGCSDSKASVCNAGDLGSISGLGRSPGEGNGSPF